MNKIILASHGELSKGMMSMLKMLVGDTKNTIHSYTLSPEGSPDDYMKVLAQEVEHNQEINYFVITDLFGGSVNNSALQYLKYPNLYLISGMIPSFIIELYLYEGNINTEVISKMLDEAKDSVKFFQNNISVNNAIEDF